MTSTPEHEPRRGRSGTAGSHRPAVPPQGRAQGREAAARVGEHGRERRGGMSNGQVAEAAGIADPGQTSKLLSRLAAQGLVSTSRGARRPGVANAWRLTEKGALVERASRG